MLIPMKLKKRKSKKRQSPFLFKPVKLNSVKSPFSIKITKSPFLSPVPKRTKPLYSAAGPSIFQVSGSKGKSIMNMNWNKAKKAYPKLNPLGDYDVDGVKNKFDCKPFDFSRQGPKHEKKRWVKKGKQKAFKREVLGEVFGEVFQEDHSVGVSAPSWKEGTRMMKEDFARPRKGGLKVTPKNIDKYMNNKWNRGKAANERMHKEMRAPRERELRKARGEKKEHRKLKKEVRDKYKSDTFVMRAKRHELKEQIPKLEKEKRWRDGLNLTGLHDSMDEEIDERKKQVAALKITKKEEVAEKKMLDSAQDNSEWQTEEDDRQLRYAEDGLDSGGYSRAERMAQQYDDDEPTYEGGEEEQSWLSEKAEERLEELEKKEKIGFKEDEYEDEEDLDWIRKQKDWPD